MAVTFVGSCPQALASWMLAAGYNPDLEVTFATSAADVATANISQYKLLYVPSHADYVRGGMDSAKVGAAVALQPFDMHFHLCLQMHAWKPLCIVRRAMVQCSLYWTPPRWAQR